MNIDRVYETGIIFLFIAFSFHLAYAGQFVIYGGEEGTQTVRTPDSAQSSVGKTETRRQQIEMEKMKAEWERMAMGIKKQINNNKPSRGVATNPGGVWIALPE